MSTRWQRESGYSRPMEQLRQGLEWRCGTTQSALGSTSRGVTERRWEQVLRRAGRGKVMGQPFVSAVRFGPYLLEGGGEPLRTDGIHVCAHARVCNRD